MVTEIEDLRPFQLSDPRYKKIRPNKNELHRLAEVASLFIRFTI